MSLFMRAILIWSQAGLRPTTASLHSFGLGHDQLEKPYTWPKRDARDHVIVHAVQSNVVTGWPKAHPYRPARPEALAVTNLGKKLN